MHASPPRVRKFILDHGHGATSVAALAVSYAALPRPVLGARWVEVDFNPSAGDPDLQNLVAAAIKRGCVLLTRAPSGEW